MTAEEKLMAIRDAFEKSFVHLATIKHWSKHKQRWLYQTIDCFVFYSVVELMEREAKKEND